MADDKKAPDGQSAETKTEPAAQSATAEAEHVQMVKNQKADIEPRKVDYQQDGEPSRYEITTEK